MNKLIKTSIAGLLLTLPGILPGQVTLEQCYQLAEQHYPLVKQPELFREERAHAEQHARAAFLPQLSVSGQASYQSQTVNFAQVMGANLPGGITLPTLSKDQYRIQADLSQTLYDGGAVKTRRKLLAVSEATKRNATEVTLYNLRDKVNQLYFGVLLMEGQNRQNDLRIASLKETLAKTEEALRLGTAFKSSVSELGAELVQAQMTTTDLQANRDSYLRMLGILTGQSFDAAVVLEIPAPTGPLPGDTVGSRPELRLFNARKKLLAAEEQQLAVQLRPRVQAFFTGAYGRPTLNIIDNTFGPWYVAGLRLNWNFGSLYTYRDDRNNLHIQQKLVELDKDAFLLNTRVLQEQQHQHLVRFEQLIAQDREAVRLRTEVSKAAQAQLANGVITTHEFITKVNAENLARQTLVLHEIQLLQARYQLRFLSGL